MDTGHTMKGEIKRQALELFIRKGIDGTTVRDIAALVGMEPSNLYAHFPSKDALVRDVVADIYAEYGDRVAAVLDTPAPLIEKLPELVSLACDLHDADTGRFLLVLSSPTQTYGPGDSRPAPIQVLLRAIGEAIMSREIDPVDPSLIVAAMIGVLEDAAFGIDGSVPISMRQRREELASICGRLLRPSTRTSSLAKSFSEEKAG